MKRILLKLSGEALSGDKHFGFSEEDCMKVCVQIKEILTRGAEVAVVTGGGNFWRGRTSDNMDRTKADEIGMMATVMNCIYVSECLRSLGVDTRIFTPFVCGGFTELYNKDEAIKALLEKKVVFFAGGTGHPYFSTDTATALRAIEIEADVILLGKAIDGIYDDDPAKNKDAKRFDKISIQDVIDKRLLALDLSASIMCLENKMPMYVFLLQEEDSIVKVFSGERIGTEVTV